MLHLKHGFYVCYVFDVYFLLAAFQFAKYVLIDERSTNERLISSPVEKSLIFDLCKVVSVTSVKFDLSSSSKRCDAASL
jgi:hypothetical protein